MIAQNGVLYGVTEFGGSSGPCNGFVGCGTVYSVALNPISETVLYSFQGPAFPVIQLVPQGDGFIGSTEFSGTMQSPGGGTIFKLSGGVETVLAPVLATAIVAGPDGAFYGTAGPGNGTLFKLTPPNVVQTLYTFKGGSDGTGPYGLTYSNGVFYGTTNGGGNGMAPSSVSHRKASRRFYIGSALSRVVPMALCRKPECNGAIYGTTRYGGNGQGVIFRVKLPGSKHVRNSATLYRFCPQAPCVDGAYPISAPVFDASGALYGTTAGGGSGNYGTVFKLQGGAL